MGVSLSPPAASTLVRRQRFEPLAGIIGQRVDTVVEIGVTLRVGHGSDDIREGFVVLAHDILNQRRCSGSLAEFVGCLPADVSAFFLAIREHQREWRLFELRFEERLGRLVPSRSRADVRQSAERRGGRRAGRQSPPKTNTTWYSVMCEAKSSSLKEFRALPDDSSERMVWVGDWNVLWCIRSGVTRFRSRTSSDALMKSIPGNDTTEFRTSPAALPAGTRCVPHLVPC